MKRRKITQRKKNDFDGKWFWYEKTLYQINFISSRKLLRKVMLLNCI